MNAHIHSPETHEMNTRIHPLDTHVMNTNILSLETRGMNTNIHILETHVMNTNIHPLDTHVMNTRPFSLELPLALQLSRAFTLAVSHLQKLHADREREKITLPLSVYTPTYTMPLSV